MSIKISKLRFVQCKVNVVWVRKSSTCTCWENKKVTWIEERNL